MLNVIYPPERASSLKHALTEAEEAVNQIQSGQEAVELGPQSAYIRRLQHLIAERNALPSESLGGEPNRRVRIYKTEKRGLKGAKI
jgi:predicted RNA-binding protein Jag